MAGHKRGTRSDYEVFTHALSCIRAQCSETRITARQAALNNLPHDARRGIVFETTTFVFDARGAYLGREYMSRDECDYFKPREESTNAD